MPASAHSPPPTTRQPPRICGIQSSNLPKSVATRPDVRSALPQRAGRRVRDEQTGQSARRSRVCWPADARARSLRRLWRLVARVSGGRIKTAHSRRIRSGCCPRVPAELQPELLLRRGLYALGCRYRLHRRDLPGLLDLVFSPSGQLSSCMAVSGTATGAGDTPRVLAIQNLPEPPPRRGCRRLTPDNGGWALVVGECAFRGRVRLPQGPVPARCASLPLAGRKTSDHRGLRRLAVPYVDGPLPARFLCSDLIRSLAPICPACWCART